MLFDMQVPRTHMVPLLKPVPQQGKTAAAITTVNGADNAAMPINRENK